MGSVTGLGPNPWSGDDDDEKRYVEIDSVCFCHTHSTHGIIKYIIDFQYSIFLTEIKDIVLHHVSLNRHVIK